MKIRKVSMEGEDKDIASGRREAAEFESLELEPT